MAAVAIPLWMRGFEVDDALISIRYARHVAEGVGYRFNAHGPVTDGVTPLPWPYLVAPLARGVDPLEALDRVKLASLVVWLAAVAAWGSAVWRARAPAFAKVAAIALLAACVPLGAHAMSGMETALATSLATLGAIAPGEWTACALVGLAASLRPEMAAWAVVLAALAGPPRRATPRVLVAVAPFTACVAARLAVFGHAAPLAVLAKPSDAVHGVVYAIPAALVSLAPVAACAPVAIARARGRALALGVAGLAHFMAIVAVGGDWMPFARLAAPVAPSLLYAFVLASPHMARALLVARVALAAALGAYVLSLPAVRAGRAVEEHVRALVAGARPLCAPARVVAALDVGWPTAACPSECEIVDLAGLTDPEIAALPGGHTSKRVDAAMLLARAPDVLLFHEPPRVVEARLLADPLVTDRYERRAFLPYADGGYGVWTRK